jgi:hypothetical protein
VIHKAVQPFSGAGAFAGIVFVVPLSLQDDCRNAFAFSTSKRLPM